MNAIAGAFLVVAFLVLSALIGGGLVLAITHVFHLQSLVALTYWQCCGVALLVGGPAGVAGSRG